MLRNSTLTEALHKFLPTLTDDEVTTAADNLLNYLEDVSVFYDLLVSDPVRYAHFQQLTAAEARATVEKVEPINCTH